MKPIRDPFSPMDTGSMAIREMYLSLRLAGFTLFESLLLIAIMTKLEMPVLEGAGEDDEDDDG